MADEIQQAPEEPSEEDVEALYAEADAARAQLKIDEEHAMHEQALMLERARERSRVTRDPDQARVSAANAEQERLNRLPTPQALKELGSTPGVHAGEDFDEVFAPEEFQGHRERPGD